MTNKKSSEINYWVQHYRDKVDESEHRYFQVGKTRYGIPVEKGQIDLIVKAITSALEPIKSDRLLDIGCGNGLLTEQLAPRADRMTGVDPSEALLQVARSCNQNADINFIQCAVGNQGFLRVSLNSGITKAYMYEVIQHLDPHEFEDLLILFNKPIFTKLFIGGIPDKSRLKQFYDSPEKLCFYKKSIADGNPHLGRWWSFDELKEICECRDLKAQYLNQDRNLYTSHYRFDLLIEKKD